jgi:hypothetical protein
VQSEDKDIGGDDIHKSLQTGLFFCVFTPSSTHLFVMTLYCQAYEHVYSLLSILTSFRINIYRVVRHCHVNQT